MFIHDKTNTVKSHLTKEVNKEQNGGWKEREENKGATR